MRCDELTELLSARLDGCLEPMEERALDEHLSRCEACRKELEALRRTVSLLQSVQPLDPPADLAARVRERTAAPPPGSAVWRILSMPELRAAAAAGVLIMLSVTVILRMDQPLSNSRAGSDTVMPRPTSEGRAMANRLSRASKDASPAPAPSEEQAVGMPTRLPAGGSADLKERTEVNGAVWRAAAPDRPTVAEAPASMAPPSAGLVAGPGSVTSGKAAATTADGPGDSFAASAAMAGWPVARAKAEPTRTRTEVATLTVVGAADADVIRSVNECLGGTAQDKGDAAESDGADGFEREEQPRAFAEAAPAMASRRRGLSISREAGQPTVIAAAVPTDSYPALLDRLQALGQVTEDPATNAVLSDSSDRSGRSAESALSSALQPADARIPVRIRILPGPATPSP